MVGRIDSARCHRINRAITENRVRLIDSQGEALGVVDIVFALSKAADQRLDLVEIAPSKPGQEAVCKILNYSKFIYDNAKRGSMLKKKQKMVKIKEVKLRPNIGVGDYALKVKNIREFVDEGHRVKVSLRLRGRELLFKDVAIDLLNKLQSDVEDISKLEAPLRREGNQFNLIFVSNK